MTEKGTVGATDVEKIGDIVVNAEVSLDEEWERQAGILADLYAEQLKLSGDKYMASLPHFDPQPPEYTGRFDTPLIVQVPIPRKGLNFDRMLDCTGITRDFYGPMPDWVDDSHGFVTPEVPYVTWINEKDLRLNHSPEAVRGELAADERGATVLDGLALYVMTPQILNGKALSFPGSEVNTHSAPILTRAAHLGMRPLIQYNYVDVRDRNLGSVIAGRKIEMGKPQLPPRLASRF